MSDFPWVGRSIMRYNSPHSTDLSFDAEQEIHVLGPAPETDDWSLGEIVESGKKGIFPKEFVVRIDPSESSSSGTINNSSTKPTEPSPPSAVEAPKASPMAIPSKPDDTVNQTPSPPPQNSPPVESEKDQGPLQVPAEEIAEDKVMPVQDSKASDPAVQPAHPLSPPPPPSDISTPTPAAPATVPSPSLDTSHAPIQKAASPAPIPAPPSPSAVKVGGMSASDAKESIKSGGSLKDRMAMFQQNAAPAASGPPPVRAKPAGNWAWKNKPAVPTPSAPEPSVTSPKIESNTPSVSVDTAPPTNSSPASQPGGMSASDAKESITKGGSLKERMAALQGKMGGAAPVPPPVPSGKPRVWKRPEAPSVPAADTAQPEEKKKSKWVVEEVSREELDGSVLKSGEDLLKSNEGAEGGIETSTAAVADKPLDEDATVPEQTEAEQTDPTEDDDEVAEKARRAAIAARMAKLGGRGMFAPPPPPPPTPVVKKEVVGDSTVAPEASTADEFSSSTLDNPPAPTQESESAALATAPLPSMPRRAAPPRRKNNATPKASDPIPVAPNPLEIPYPKTDEEKAEIAKQENLAKGEHGAEGAERAGIALEAPEEGEQMEDQPLVSDEVGTKENVPAFTATRVESSEPESYSPADGSAPSVAHHADEKPIVAGLDNLSIQSRGNSLDTAAVSQEKRMSIPLPERESSVNLDDAEFRQIIQTPSAINFVGSEGHAQGPASSEKISGTSEQDQEKEEANSEEPTRELAMDEDEDLEEPAPPPPPRRSSVLPSLPPKTVDLSEEEEGARTDEEGLGHSEAEDIPTEEPVSLPPPRRTSMLPPPPPPNPDPVLGDEEADMDASISDEEEADAEVEEDEQEGSEIGEEAPPPPPARPSLPLLGQTDIPSSAISSGNTAPLPSRQRPAVPLPSVPAQMPAEETIASPASPAPPARPPIPFEAPVSSLSPPPIPATVGTDMRSAESDRPEEGTSQSSEADIDPDIARRQSIAARMAKLGGTNQFRLFGGPPIPMQKPVAVTEGNEEDGSTQEEGSTSKATMGATDEAEAEEDDEVRRARARAKLAAMGGMRMGGFGIAQPVSAPPPPPPVETPVEQERSGVKPAQIEDEELADQPHQEDVIEHQEAESTVDPEQPHQRSNPVLDAPPRSLTGEDYQFDVPSFETESSTPNLLLKSPVIEEVPPPLPTGRPNRNLPPLATESLPGTHQSETIVRSPISASPVASPSSPIAPNRRSSLKKFSGVFNTRKSSDGGRPILEAMEPSSIDSGSVPQMIYPQHDLPPLPPTAVVSSPIVGDSTSISQSQSQFTNADLVQFSKTNGNEVLKAANTLLQQSKKSVIADGTSLGFVRESLQISHCQAPNESEMTFGHLIFHQIGKSVQARRDDIRLGDIVLVEHAHFKGKKGLGHYTTDVEFDSGVVLEFDAKKSKVKVAQAVGKANAYPTLEANSFKLEDLQSGSIKFFRPLA